MIDNNASAADPFGQIADEFVEAFRHGKHPSVEEFARRYPEQADEIRDMLPALMLMEQAKSAADTTGPGRQATPAAGAAPLQPLGDYRILHEIGRGRMGVVYRACDTALDRDVAVNLLSDRIATVRAKLGADDHDRGCRTTAAASQRTWSGVRPACV